MAFLVAASIVGMGVVAYEKYRYSESWIQAVLDIPDFHVTENPTVRHVRIVEEGVKVTWFIELLSLPTKTQLCSSSGTSYLGTEESQNFRFTFDGMFRKEFAISGYPCKPDPGRYKVQLIYTTEGRHPFVTYSNEFTILPKK